MNVTILVRFHEHHNHAFSLSFTDVEEEKNIFKDLIHFHNFLFLGPEPDPGSLNFTILVETFMKIIIMHLVFSQVQK